MAKRMHLDSIHQPQGAVWFTLVVGGTGAFYVERYEDAPRPFLKEQLQIIRFADFHKHIVNGVSLTRLVADKFRELNFQEEPEALTETLPATPPLAN